MTDIIPQPNTPPQITGINLNSEPNATVYTTGTVPYPRNITRDEEIFTWSDMTNGVKQTYTVPEGQDLYLTLVCGFMTHQDTANFVTFSFAPPGEAMATEWGMTGLTNSPLNYTAAPKCCPSGTSFEIFVNANSHINYGFVALHGILQDHDNGLWD